MGGDECGGGFGRRPVLFHPRELACAHRLCRRRALIPRQPDWRGRRAGVANEREPLRVGAPDAGGCRVEQVPQATRRHLGQVVLADLAGCRGSRDLTQLMLEPRLAAQQTACRAEIVERLITL